MLTFTRFQMCTNPFWGPLYSKYHDKLHNLFSVFHWLVIAGLVSIFQLLRFSDIHDTVFIVKHTICITYLNCRWKYIICTWHVESVLLWKSKMHHFKNKVCFYAHCSLRSFFFFFFTLEIKEHFLYKLYIYSLFSQPLHIFMANVKEMLC